VSISKSKRSCRFFSLLSLFLAQITNPKIPRQTTPTNIPNIIPRIDKVLDEEDAGVGVDVIFLVGVIVAVVVVVVVVVYVISGTEVIGLVGIVPL
jgi:hypothetical protein